jgi:hypothetical protein
MSSLRASSTNEAGVPSSIPTANGLWVCLRGKEGVAELQVERCQVGCSFAGYCSGRHFLVIASLSMRPHVQRIGSFELPLTQKSDAMLSGY